MQPVALEQQEYGGPEPIRISWQQVNALTRPRIVLLVLITAAGGYLAEASHWDISIPLLLLTGLALVVAGANAANQILERDVDAKMRRTQRRPLATGVMTVRTAWCFVLSALATGTFLLAMTGTLPALLGLTAFGLYVFVYTPMKRLSPASLYVGAIPGALPPLIGSAAACGHISANGIALFLLLFAWQIPHFLAIGWLYREDYARADLKVMAVQDTTGKQSGAGAILFSVLILLAFPFAAMNQMLSYPAAGVAVIAGLYLCIRAWAFARRRDAASAKSLFMSSNIFLLLIMGVIAGAKLQVL